MTALFAPEHAPIARRTRDFTRWSELQERAYRQLLEAVSTGKHKATVAVAPTGFGKTRLAQMLIERWVIPTGAKCLFLTHRKMLLQQTWQRFTDHGLEVGVRASEWGHEEWLDRNIQLAMFESEMSATEAGKRELHEADIVIVDEAHANKSGKREALMREYMTRGATVIGMTATPIGIGHLYTDMQVLATNSELRKAGGILLAEVYAPDEIDVSDVKTTTPDGEFNQKELGKRFAVQQVVGRVIDWWQKLNPQALPAIGFAPGVQESMWFTDQFIERGIPAAHIDGETVYLGEKDSAGEPVVYRSNRAKREQVKEMSKDGTVKIVWNRYVMREGADWPHLYHCILATAFATEESYVQSVGRVLRSDDSLGDKVLITDHGGNIWRPSLGSPNIDREWELGDTNKSRRQEAKKRIQEGEEKAPLCCPKCAQAINWAAWNKAGGKCPHCGHAFKKVVRWVQQTDGTLKRVVGSPVKVKKRSEDPQKAWDKMFWPSLKSKNDRSSTFTQLLNRFHNDNPQFRVVMNRGQDVAVAVHRETGERTVLGNIPRPSSACWDVRVKNVSRDELQRPVRQPVYSGDEQ